MPHYEAGACIQAITFRLADALPEEVLRKLEELSRDDAARRLVLERYLDAGSGACLLRRSENARCVVNAWQYFDRRRYLLHAWVVMPSHAHVLVEPPAGWKTREIVHSRKSYTAKRILNENPRVATTGPGSTGVPHASQKDAARTAAFPAAARRVWHRDYFDRYVRDEGQYLSAVAYIQHNPVRAGLCRRAGQWPWSSASSPAPILPPPALPSASPP
ncbi:transposase [Opitutaceae bacterium EW11]|nr:transposase [Opitutaceae bacterium EW11]